MLKLELRFPANAASAPAHAALAVSVARQEFDRELDYSPGSLEELDAHVESLRDEGLSAEAAAEALFVFGCYVGEVMVRALGGGWRDTARTRLAGVSPWPMVVVLPDGSAWDVIGKVYKRLEVGDSEYLPAYFVAAARGAHNSRTGPRGEANVAGERDKDESPDALQSVEIPIAPELDLHSFVPAEVADLVDEYLRLCRERGILSVRLIHGRGKGVQRAIVRRLLAGRSDVLGFEDAPPDRGHWGATVVQLKAPESRAGRRP